jgi:hypothetical protein
MATPPPTLDPQIAALDPSIRKMRRAKTSEVMSATGRTLLRKSPPPEKDYTAQRARYIAMLNQLDEMETKLKQEDGKTLRSRMSMASTLFKAISSMEVANVAGRSGVQQERMKVLGDRLNQLSEDMGKRGPREFSDIAGTAAGKGLNALAVYSDGSEGVRPGDTVAFVEQVNKDLGTITDPRDVAVYVKEVKNRYGIDLVTWMTGNAGDAGISPYAQTLVPRLQASLAAQEKAVRWARDAHEEYTNIFQQLQSDPSVGAGSALGRGVNTALQILGELPGDTKPKAPTPPPANASAEVKRKYVKAIGGDELDIDDKGNVVETVDVNGNKTVDTMSYREFLAQASETAPAGGSVAVSEKRRPYLSEQRKLILKELDKLENAEDPVSRQTRATILSSSQLASWAKEHGYESYRPEQQFKALLVYRKKQLGEQDAAFRKQLDSDVLAGEAGNALSRATVKARRFLTGETAERQQLIDAGLEAAKKGKSGADLTAGAVPPAGRTPAGNTEADPKNPKPPAEGPKDGSFWDGPPAKEPTSEDIWGAVEGQTPQPATFKDKPAETVEAAMREEKDVPSLEEAEKAPAPMSGETAAGSKRDIGFGITRGRMESQIGAFLKANSNLVPPTPPEDGTASSEELAQQQELYETRLDLYTRVSDAYAKAQALKNKPTEYAAALDNVSNMIKRARVRGSVLTPGEDKDFRSDEVKARGNAALPEASPAPEPDVTEPADDGSEILLGEMEDDEQPEAEAPGAEVEAPSLGVEAETQPTPEPVSLEQDVPADEAAPEAEGGLSGFGRSLQRGAQSDASPVMFNSFGAEGATKQAETAKLAYQTAEENRRRRLAALRGSMGA